MHYANAGNDACAGHLTAVLGPGGEAGEFQKRGAGIDQQVDPLAYQKLASLAMTRDHIRSSAACGGRDPLAKDIDPCLLRRAVAPVNL